MKYFLITCSFLAMVCMPFPASSADLSHYLYRETTGDDSKELFYRVEQGVVGTVTCTEPGEKRRTVVDQAGGTLEWEMTREDSDIVARLEGDTITVEGERDGKPVSKVHAKGEHPWFQLLFYSLKIFVDSGEPSVTFWIIRPDTFSFAKLVAKRQGVENLVVWGQEVPAEKVLVSPPWPLSCLWKGYYWFRKSDGLFLKFEGASGGPGSEMTVVQIVEQQKVACTESQSSSGNLP